RNDPKNHQSRSDKRRSEQGPISRRRHFISSGVTRASVESLYSSPVGEVSTTSARYARWPLSGVSTVVEARLLPLWISNSRLVQRLFRKSLWSLSAVQRRMLLAGWLT